MSVGNKDVHEFSTTGTERLDQAVDRFENAWRQGQQPVIDDYLPADDDRRLAVLIDLVHADMECRLKNGGATRVGAYLERYPELAGDSGVVLALIAAEYALRRTHEPGLGLADYLQRFPKYREELPARLETASLRGPPSEANADTLVPDSQVATSGTDSVAAFIQVLRNSRLLQPAQLVELAGLEARFAQPEALATELVQRGWLTSYQSEQLLQGHGGDLILGSYILLDFLGQGGMGQVFKARHQHLRRIVALKIIRKERLTDSDVVRRFQREAKAAARLTHPNIVSVYDADQAGERHFLAMEYIDGIDLTRLVKSSGPVPLVKACNYVRQASLGLQHAFERGLVHRDIKPANLLLASEGSVVKVLDLGLARLERLIEDYQTPSLLTEEGAVMGTPDFMAPEQALDPRKADIRADIYSLGCTLYYLLTGQPPYPGGTLAQKLLWHQQAETPAVATLRSDVPRGLAAVLDKMLAKRPEDRFQTPAEVAATLEPFCRSEACTLTSPEAKPETWAPVTEATLSSPSGLALRPMPKAPSKKRSYFAGRWLNLAKRWQVWALANAAVVFVVVLALLLGQAGFTRLRNLYLALMVVLIVGLFIISVGWWVLRAEPRRERMLKKKTGAQGYGKGDQPVPGYHLAQFLGRGSFGEVWKASAPGGTECALKIIRFDDAQAFKELRAICWRVKGMHHPHLTPIIAFWFKDQQGNMLSDPSDAELGSLKRPVTELIIAMGLGEKNLADRLKECLAEGKPGIPARELLVYMAEAAKAIDFLNQPRHELGTKRVAIRRGDIKPQNILIVGGCAQVCDFGLPQQLTYARKVSMAAGTYAYIAPESIENKLSKTNDQYSLAICYVELRTGSLPFSANSLYEVMFAHLQGKLDFSKLSEAERAVLKRATATNPDHRFPNTVEMVRALRQAIKEET